MTITADDTRAVWRRSQARTRERAEILDRNRERLRASRARFVHARDELLQRLLESTCAVLEHSALFRSSDVRAPTRARVVDACLIVEVDDEVRARVSGDYEMVVLWRLVRGCACTSRRNITNADPILLAALVIDGINESG